jgi:hypothetical protein
MGIRAGGGFAPNWRKEDLNDELRRNLQEEEE